jgi:hypothetical protein
VWKITNLRSLIAEVILHNCIFGGVLVSEQLANANMELRPDGWYLISVNEQGARLGKSLKILDEGVKL